MSPLLQLSPAPVQYSGVAREATDNFLALYVLFVWQEGVNMIIIAGTGAENKYLFNNKMSPRYFGVTGVGNVRGQIFPAGLKLFFRSSLPHRSSQEL